MNPVRKRLKLSPSKLQHAVSSISTTQNVTSSKFVSHDALLAPHAASVGPRDEQEEEEETYLFVEEDTTDSSLVITMGITHGCLSFWILKNLIYIK